MKSGAFLRGWQRPPAVPPIRDWSGRSSWFRAKLLWGPDHGASASIRNTSQRLTPIRPIFIKMPSWRSTRPRASTMASLFLHAIWIAAVAPQAGDTVCHIGAGTGYYTAILSVLTLPGGAVHAFEIEQGLAEQARDNLRPFEAVSVTHGDATQLPLPLSDLIYVNAGVAVPPPSWLQALRPQGRMVFPWRPSEAVALAIVITRRRGGFSVKPLMNSYFIPCIGAPDAAACLKLPDRRQAWAVRSIWLTAEREPDQTAVGICEQVWFSTAEIPETE
jgi:protein-L-isoaspartate(D-aspartate) O-methyltransferase